jgi:hypothetical protein
MNPNQPGISVHRDHAGVNSGAISGGLGYANSVLKKLRSLITSRSNC